MATGGGFAAEVKFYRIEIAFRVGRNFFYEGILFFICPFPHTSKKWKKVEKSAKYFAFGS